MNTKRILRYVKRGDFTPFYAWFLAKTIWPLLHKDLSKKNAMKVMEEDWDYLIILDACRYDTFKEVVGEEVSYAISGATDTQAWMIWNFRENYKDVIYIAGNPHFASAHLNKTLGFIPFYMIKEVWDYGWDSTLKTVPPEQVTNAAIEALKSFPEKRMIIHYNQPHHPFLGDKELTQKDDGTWHTLKGGLWGGKKTTIWRLVQQGEVPLERAKEAYKENLRIVMKEVDKLKEKLPGRVILTADHGELFREWGLYGHGSSLRVEGLVKVPWVLLKDEEKQLMSEDTYVQKRKLQAKITKLRQSKRL